MTDIISSMLLNPEILVWLIGIGFPVLLLAMLIVQDKRNAGKHLCLYFISDKEVDLLQKPVREGKITIGKKAFYVDEDDCPVMPDGHIVKSMKPIHILRWNSAVPMTVVEKGIKFMSPSNLKNFIENKALDQLLTPKGQDKMIFLFLILGLVVGVAIGYVLPTVLKGG